MLLRTAGAPLICGIAFGLFGFAGAACAQYYPAYPAQAYPRYQQPPVVAAEDEDDPFYDPPVVRSQPLPPPPGALPPGYPQAAEGPPRLPGYMAREVPPGAAHPAYPPPAAVGEPDGGRPPLPIGPGSVGPGVTGSVAPDARFASLPAEVRPESGAMKPLPPKFQRTLVDYRTKEPAGTIIIDTPNTYLYLVLGGGKAMRYGVGVGREGFTWNGTQKITRMAEWPDWNPPEEMIERQPYLPRFMAGGDGNPLGARALYLGSTIYRIHGTNQPSTIGTFVSSGCIRLTNEDVTDLYKRVKVGTRVVVLPGSAPPSPHSLVPQAAAPPGALPPGAVPGGSASISNSPLPPPPSAMAR